jgi:signal transduction histidine kinase
MRSLRFSLPAFFLLGVLIAGVVTAAITITLVQADTENQTVSDLRRQARELGQLFAENAVQAVDEGTSPPTIVVPRLELATGTRLYYAGTGLFPGAVDGLRDITLAQAGLSEVPDRQRTLEIVPPGEDSEYVAIAEPVELLGAVFGALIVAKPKAELGGSWGALVWRASLAFIGGVAVAAFLFVYLSRRVTKPLLALSQAADEVAAGSLDVVIPPARSRDEIGHLTDRFAEMTRRLAEAEELERNFLMTVSHELRTPLTAIRGHVDALQDGLAEDPDARASSLDVIGLETDRLARLVGDLLDLAKLDANRFTLQTEEVDLGQLLEHAYQRFADEAKRRDITYEQELGGAPMVITDGDRVLQIVSNVLENAFQWTPDGGSVRLAVDVRGDALNVSIADSGPGVPLEDRERIFRPFWSRNGHGTGLGLAIAQELAQALGGALTLESQGSGGSRFTFVLPRR